MNKQKGLLHTPEKTPLVTPETTPVDIGHLSGGEWNQTHGTPPPEWPKKKK